MSRTLSMNCGSLDNLKVSLRCGLSPNAFQIRPTVERDNPLSAAIDARDQCVASAGVRSRVDTTTASICSSAIFRGAPGRGSSDSPSRPDSTNRRRHVPTVCGHTPTPDPADPPPPRPPPPPPPPPPPAPLFVRLPRAPPPPHPPPHPPPRPGFPPPRPPQQRLPLLLGQGHLGHRPSHPRHNRQP